jgi:hypothetical protein
VAGGASLSPGRAQTGRKRLPIFVVNALEFDHIYGSGVIRQLVNAALNRVVKVGFFALEYNATGMGTTDAHDPSVFIIESLNFDDEDEQRREGHLLYEMLHLAGKPAEYYYLRTKKELAALLKRYAQSGKRYLHISCHGDSRGIGLTLDYLTFQELGDLARPHLRDRRLFLSACDVAREELAAAVMERDGCYSVIGPVDEIGFSDAAIMWASFYHLVFKENSQSMNRDRVARALQKVCDAFGTSVCYFRRTTTAPYFRSTTFRPTDDDTQQRCDDE